MNDIFIISYTCDKLEDYFLKCNEDIVAYLSHRKIDINVHCNHDSCNREEIHSKLKDYDDNYIVTIYAHGENERIINNSDEDLINLDDAKSYYNNAIVYSGCCFSGNELGKTMHSYQCKLFYGYVKKFYLAPFCKDTFVELNNFALKEILIDNQIDANLLCERINKFFDNKMEEFKSHDPTTALLLNPLIMHNREAYVIYKDKKEYPSK